MQSNLLKFDGLHVAIIMDGNGRWAQRRGRPRTAGHEAGAQALRRTIEAAPAAGVGTLTVFAFSADNWRRPAVEIDALMVLLSTYLARETRRLADAGVRLEVIGRRDRLADGLIVAIERAEAVTAAGNKLHLRIALDYSGRDAIVMAAARCGLTLTREKFARALCGAAPDVDLLIRTGGEQRLSDFLLWDCAYAELMSPSSCGRISTAPRWTPPSPRSAAARAASAASMLALPRQRRREGDEPMPRTRSLSTRARALLSISAPLPVFLILALVFAPGIDGLDSFFLGLIGMIALIILSVIEAIVGVIVGKRALN